MNNASYRNYLDSWRIQQEPYTLSKVRLANIKSIDEVELPIRKLNVMLGSNSAGKSTLLQCLAFLSQNSANYGRRDLALNGNLVKLGLYEEFKRRGNVNEPEIEIELTSPRINRRQWLSNPGEGFYSSEHLSQPIKISACFRLDKVESNRGSAKIKSGSLKLIGSSEESAWSWEEIPITFDGLRNHKFVKFTNNDIGHFEDSKNSIDLSPTSIFRYQRYNEWLVSNLRFHMIAGNRRRARQGVNSRTVEANIGKIINIHAQYLKELTTAPLGEDVSDFYFALLMDSVQNSKIDYFLNYVKHFEQGELEEMVDTILVNSPLRERLLLLPLLDSSSTDYAKYSNAARQVTDFFREKIHYLGPLRLEPAALQKQDQEPSANAPVGVKGEYFGYQLAYGTLSKQIKSYPRPRKQPEKKQSLEHAVQEWMQWIDIGAEIKVLEEGISGLQTLTDDETLYQKGTGLSQIIPVLVLGLVAEPGSLTLIEQPELHLHPAVQQKLGDFLLQISKSGRFLLVESHSEYMVTRLRKLVFVDGEDSSNVSIVFASKVSDNQSKISRTSLSIAEITSTGELDSWPTGFFDFVNDDEADILMKRFMDSP